MKGTTKWAIAAVLLATLVSGCAEQANPSTRPTLAGGSNLAGTADATLQNGQGSVTCQAVAASSPVISGSVFQVNVRLTNGTLPYSVVGFINAVKSEWTAINATIVSGSTASVMATRKVTVRDAKGISGTCAFAVSVNPT